MVICLYIDIVPIFLSQWGLLLLLLLLLLFIIISTDTKLSTKWRNYNKSIKKNILVYEELTNTKKLLCLSLVSGLKLVAAKHFPSKETQINSINKSKLTDTLYTYIHIYSWWHTMLTGDWCDMACLWFRAPNINKLRNSY